MRGRAVLPQKMARAKRGVDGGEARSELEGKDREVGNPLEGDGHFTWARELGRGGDVLGALA